MGRQIKQTLWIKQCCHCLSWQCQKQEEAVAAPEGISQGKAASQSPKCYSSGMSYQPWSMTPTVTHFVCHLIHIFMWWLDQSRASYIRVIILDYTSHAPDGNQVLIYPIWANVVKRIWWLGIAIGASEVYAHLISSEDDNTGHWSITISN